MLVIWSPPQSWVVQGYGDAAHDWRFAEDSFLINYTQLGGGGGGRGAQWANV